MIVKMKLQLVGMVGIAALIGSAPLPAEILSAEVMRQPDGSFVVTWTAASDTLVDVRMGDHASADAAAMQLVSRADGDGVHVQVDGPARPVFLLEAPGSDPIRVAERLIPAEGTVNLRDLGGYPTVDGRRVRWGLIYRSASLDGIGGDDRDVLEALGVRMIYDLRSVEERSAAPTNWPIDGAVIRAIDYSMDTSEMAEAFASGIDAERARGFMRGFYVNMVDSHQTQFREVFAELLEDQSGAVLYHCTAGKDRTGAQSALILGALGVPRDTILEDFELSNRYYRSLGDTGGISGPLAGLPKDVQAVFAGVETEYLEAFLDEIDRRYGGMEGYLAQGLGIGAQELGQLRLRYTD